MSIEFFTEEDRSILAQSMERPIDDALLVRLLASARAQVAQRYVGELRAHQAKQKSDPEHGAPAPLAPSDNDAVAELMREQRAAVARAALEEKGVVQPARDELQEQIDLILWVTQNDPQQEIDALKDLAAEQAAELASLREDRSFPAMNEKLIDYAPAVDEADLTTADLTEDAIQRLTKAKRKKFTELLNVELAELQQERGGPREDLKRENEIEALLGLFARVGEM